MNKQASVDMADDRRKLKEKRNHLAAGDGVVGHDLLRGGGESGHRDEASQEVVGGGVLGGRDGAEKTSETQGRRRRS